MRPMSHDVHLLLWHLHPSAYFRLYNHIILRSSLLSFLVEVRATNMEDNYNMQSYKRFELHRMWRRFINFSSASRKYKILHYLCNLLQISI